MSDLLFVPHRTLFFSMLFLFLQFLLAAIPSVLAKILGIFTNIFDLCKHQLSSRYFQIIHYLQKTLFCVLK